MFPERFKKALATLDMTQARFADLLGLSDRTVRLYASAGVTSVPVVIIIRLMLAAKIGIQDIEDVMKGRRQ